MDKSIVQLVDELPSDNITIKVLKAIDYVAPSQWNNLTGFDNTIRTLTGETEPQAIQKIRDRAVSLYHDPKTGYQNAIKLYQTIDKADMAMATAALANKVGEKISFLSFLGNITPNSNLTQTIDLSLKIAVEIVAFCQINGIPQPNPQEFLKALTENYQKASLMRMIALVCIDGMLPLGPDFLNKIHTVLSGTESSNIAQNPVFLAVNSSLPGNTAADKLGFISQGFNAVQGWMTNLISKTGLTPQSISQSLGSFIQIADDNLDFVAAVLDQTTNYYEHTGIQTVAERLILQAYTLVKEEIKQQAALAAQTTPKTPTTPSDSSVVSKEIGEYLLNQKVEVWSEDDEDWYEATIQKVKEREYFIHYVGYGSSDDEWVNVNNIRTRNLEKVDDNGYGVGMKVKCWDNEEEDWYTAVIEKVEGHQYYLHYLDYDSSYNEWVDLDDIC